jgi:hypothetical protein
MTGEALELKPGERSVLEHPGRGPGDPKSAVFDRLDRGVSPIFIAQAWETGLIKSV